MYYFKCEQHVHLEESIRYLFLDILRFGLHSEHLDSDDNQKHTKESNNHKKHSRHSNGSIARQYVV